MPINAKMYLFLNWLDGPSVQISWSWTLSPKCSLMYLRTYAVYHHCLVMIVVIWQKAHWYTLVPEPDYDSVQCDTVCFPMGTGNFILINTREAFRKVNLHHRCVAICSCCSQLACIICFHLQLVNKVMQQKLCEQLLKSWQQIFKGAFLFIFLCPTILTFLPLIPCGHCSKMFL